MSSYNRRIGSIKPVGYETPQFPALYNPFPIDGEQSNYLYDISDMVRFVLLWTMMFYGAAHLIVVAYSAIVQLRSWRVILGICAVYIVIGGMEAVIAGSITGALVGMVYIGGQYHMSTWMPFVWALINTLILILSSFSIQGGL